MARKCGFVCYIDESGDEGFKFVGGSTNWFILSALLVTSELDLSVTKTVEALKDDLDWPRKKQLHWRDLRHLEKMHCAKKISEQSCRTLVVAVHKPSLIETEVFQERYRLYFYSARYLLERVSWAVREWQRWDPQPIAKVSLVFSNRSGMSYSEVKQYLARLRAMSESGQDVRIEWEYIDDELVKAVAPGKLNGLQLADAVGGAFFNALQRDRHGRLKPEYARTLQPIVFRYRGRYWGNGLKLVPREAALQVPDTEGYEWLGAYRN